jgi:hypothetical protein
VAELEDRRTGDHRRRQEEREAGRRGPGHPGEKPGRHGDAGPGYARDDGQRLGQTDGQTPPQGRFRAQGAAGGGSVGDEQDEAHHRQHGRYDKRPAEDRFRLRFEQDAGGRTRDGGRRQEPEQAPIGGGEPFGQTVADEPQPILPEEGDDGQQGPQVEGDVEGQAGVGPTQEPRG